MRGEFVWTGSQMEEPRIERISSGMMWLLNRDVGVLREILQQSAREKNEKAEGERTYEEASIATTSEDRHSEMVESGRVVELAAEMGGGGTVIAIVE